MERLVVVGALTFSGDFANLQAVDSLPQFRFVNRDIRDDQFVDELLRREVLDGIVNFAAETSVDRSIHEPAAFQRTNVERVVSLLEAARRIWSGGGGVDHCFHQVYTVEVFGTGPGPGDGAPCDGTTPYFPSSPLPATKAAVDLLVMAWRNTLGLNVSISCSSNG